MSATVLAVGVGTPLLGVIEAITTKIIVVLGDIMLAIDERGNLYNMLG